MAHSHGLDGGHAHGSAAMAHRRKLVVVLASGLTILTLEVVAGFLSNSLALLADAGHNTSLDPLLLELVRIRASQLTGCAHCLEMHIKDALALGETDLRACMVAVWDETELYSERERAALRWTEELTLLPSRTVPDELYVATRTVFSEQELVQLTMVIITINAWNRLAISFRASVGDYVSRHERAAVGAGHK